MAQSLPQAVFKLAYELSPIILVNGLAASLPGKMLPIIALTQAGNFALSLLNGTSPIDDNAFFAHFRPAPGGTLIDNQMGDYPLLNQVVAANALIARPLQLSMIMECPANQPGAYVGKLATITALQAALSLHNNSGGTYTVATPSFIYTNGLCLNLRDVSRQETNQAQNRWQWDFAFPLLTTQQANAVLGPLAAKVGAALATSS